MPDIRVLIVDDAVVVRKVLTDALGAEAGIAVAGTASNGEIALQRLSQLQPEVVVLDIEMPVMDGLATLTALRKDYPRLPVIMYSTLTERGANATLDALQRGASDYVTKPSNTGSLEVAQQVVRAELVPKIRALAEAYVQSGGDAVPAPPPAPRPVPAAPVGGQRVDCVVVASSTGGPNAIPEVIKHLPADLPVPVLCVQHMPPLFTKMFADRLNTNVPLEAFEAADGDAVRAGTFAVAPGDYHMIVQRQGAEVTLRTHQGPPVNSCRPAADLLFQSAAQVYGPHILGVVITGMGQDGLRGCEHIREAGGQVLAQDEATATVWGMPGYVAKAGLAQAVLPLGQIGPEIARLCALGRSVARAA